MEEKIEQSMRFYLLATTLKYKIRSGWDKNHWNVNAERIESIAEHVYGTCILAISIASNFKYDIDLNKVIKMLVLHELEEVVIGDITPFDNISNESKLQRGHKAIVGVIGDLIKKDELISLILEFDEKKTKESIFAYHCDKLEADIQAKVYEDMGCQHLDNQENNVVMNSSKVQEIINKGAQTVAEVWQLYDQDKFSDDRVFSKTLKFVNKVNTEKLKENYDR